MALTFEWDPRKDSGNRRKHDVGFDEALTVFADPLGRIVTTRGTKKAARKATPTRARVAENDILPEYDFSRGRPNPYAKRLAHDSVIVVLDPDVARLFPDAATVNDALRALARIAKRTPRRARSKRRTA